MRVNPFNPFCFGMPQAIDSELWNGHFRPHGSMACHCEPPACLSIDWWSDFCSRLACYWRRSLYQVGEHSNIHTLIIENKQTDALYLKIPHCSRDNGEIWNWISSIVLYIFSANIQNIDTTTRVLQPSLCTNFVVNTADRSAGRRDKYSESLYRVTISIRWK